MMGIRASNPSYSQIRPEEDLEDENSDEKSSSSDLGCKTDMSRTLVMIVLFQSLVLVLTISALIWSLQQPRSVHKPSEPQSPPSAISNYLQFEEYNTPVVLGVDDPKMTLQNSENNQLWAELRPLYGGVVRLPTDDAQSIGLPSSATLEPLYPGHSVYQIAAFHQLHCLGMIRDQLTLPEPDRSVEGTQSHKHILHCVEYLRKILLCNVDITLDPTTDYYYYGTNSSRQCRDWDALYTWWQRTKFHEFESFLSTKPEPPSHLG